MSEEKGTPDEGESDLSAAHVRIEAETERAAAAEARVRELETDRNEWREQHENLLVMYQRSVAEVDALKTEWAEHDGVPILEREVKRLREQLAAANALPGRIWEALGELTSYLLDGDHVVKVDDVRRMFERRLSAQPAAPNE